MHLCVIPRLLLPQHCTLCEDIIPQVLGEVHQVLFVEDVKAIPCLCTFVELDLWYFRQDAWRDVVARDVHLREVISRLHR